MSTGKKLIIRVSQSPNTIKDEQMTPNMSPRSNISEAGDPKIINKLQQSLISEKIMIELQLTG